MSTFTIARDDASAPFFDAAAAGRLLIRRCAACGRFFPAQTRRCPDGAVPEWTEASGLGTLVSWAVDHSGPLDPALAAPDGETSMFGFVELEEGPWMQTPIVGAERDELHGGRAMRVTFVRPGDGEWIPAFTPG